MKPNGKHFIKIDGESILDEKFASNEDGDTLMVFDTAEEAAKKFDEIITGRGKAHDTEMNFKTDGSRIVYEDSAAGASAGRGVEMLGGGANSVVPALSVINIKVCDDLYCDIFQIACRPPFFLDTYIKPVFHVNRIFLQM